MTNKKPGTFRKGDPRINRKGRPRSFDALRELAQQIAHESTGIIADGHKVTVTEAILRQWAQSKNPILQRAFLEIAFGKVPDNIDITSKGLPLEIGVRAIDYRSDLATLAPRPVRDSDASGEDKDTLDGAQVG